MPTYRNLGVNYKMGDTVLGTTVKENTYELQQALI